MKREVPRKLFHLFFGTFFLWLIWFAGTETTFYIIGSIFLAGLAVSLAIKKGHNLPLFSRVVAVVEREHEKHFPGKAAHMFFLAALLLLYIFNGNPELVLAGLATAVYGDSAAALVGRGIGKIKIGFNNTLEGSLACFLVCLPCIGVFFPLGIFPATALALPAATATIAEYFPINDNISMPLVSAATLHILLLLTL